MLLPSPALADRVRLLETDREAAEARVEMVLAAREEILASAFIFGDDPFTLTSLALLRDAVRRGLRVQVIVDAQWNKIPRPVQTQRATRIDSRGFPEGAKEPYPGIPRRKVLKLRLYRLLTPLIKNQL